EQNPVVVNRGTYEGRRSHAVRNDWAWEDGEQHGAAAYGGRAFMCGLRRPRGSGGRLGSARGGWRAVAGRVRSKAVGSEGYLDDGPRWSGGLHPRQAHASFTKR